MVTPSVSSPSFHPRRALYAGVASAVTVAILIIIKTIAYVSEGSAGVLAALIDSGADAAGSLVNLLAIHLSLKPADKHHRYGHGKVEGLAALVQAMLILGGAGMLAVEAAVRLSHPVPLENHGLSMGVMVVSIALSIVLVMIQNASLRHAPSLAVAADKAHYGSDIVVNIAVLAALALQMQGGPLWIDSAVALAVGVWLARTAWQVAKGGIDMLLDREVDDTERMNILACVRAHPRVRGMHDLRTRMMGMNLSISFDIAVDADLTLRQAHEIAREVETCLLEKYPHADIMIHVDPSDDTADSRHTQVGVRPE